jgi:hypothetical protein
MVGCAPEEAVSTDDPADGVLDDADTTDDVDVTDEADVTDDVGFAADDGRRDAGTPDRPDVVRDAPVVLDRAPPMDVPRVTDVPRDSGLVPVPRPSSVAPGAACHDLLRRLGVRFVVAGATRGVVDPVTVTPPIAGVHYRYASWTATERPMLMDCRLGVALVGLSRQLRSQWNIDDVQHIGIYNCRTIAGSTRLSQHAYAMGIDLGALRDTSGTTYSVLTQFTMNGAPTCPPRATNARDRVLKEVACWMYDSRMFNIILTPNYNAAHRNHFHVDLTPGSHFVQAPLPEGVDPPHDPLTDWLIDDE